MNSHGRMSRRQWLVASAAAGAGWAIRPSRLPAGGLKRPIGACDWSIGKRGAPEAFAVAKALGLNGVQVSFGKPDAPFDLRKPEARAAYVKAAGDTGQAFASLAMGILNSVPYASSPDAEQWVSDCVDVMATLRKEAAALEDRELAARVSPDQVLLAFFGTGDIKGKDDAIASVIARLKKVAPRAEKAGVVLGLETWLDVDDHLRILDAVDSPSVKVYYDVANMTKQGYDIYAEIKRLGRERICQMHAKENGFLLGEGKVDFPRLKGVLDDIGYNGWLIIESARPRGLSLEEAYAKNRAYLQSVFGKG